MPPKVATKNIKPDLVSSDVSTASTASTASVSTTDSELDIVKVTDYDYLPLIVEVTSPDNSDFLTNADIKFSKDIDYPKFSLGFHHYIHMNKNKMEIVNQFKDKKKVYHVMNKFERFIDNYDNDIGHYGTNFLEISKDVPDILSRGFYKLWEIIHMFDIIPTTKGKFTSAHLAEGPGAFIQATMFYRDKYADDSKNDKFYAITLHPNDENGHVPELEKQFVKYYDQEKPKRFIQHKTVSTQIAGGYDNKDNGDLTDPKTVLLFGGQLSEEKIDFITADGGFEWNNENTQEQEAFRLIFAQIYTACKISSKSGNFVCKFFETFTDSGSKLVYLLTQFYKKVYLVKPLTSRPSNSEKYAVCIDFKYTNTDSKYKTLMKELADIHKTLHQNKDMNIVGIWDKINLPNEFKQGLILCNQRISNKQIKNINEIVQFINDQNYYGDNYQMHRQMQIDASKYWIKMFMPDKKEFIKTLDIVRKSTNMIIEKSNKIIENVRYI